MPTAGYICAVMNCDNTAGMQNEEGKISFFSFPKDPSQKKTWEIFTKRANLVDKFKYWEASSSSKICHLHFIPEAYNTHFYGNGKVSQRRLLANAPPPSLCPPIDNRGTVRRSPKKRFTEYSDEPPTHFLPRNGEEEYSDEINSLVRINQSSNPSNI